MLEIVKKNVDKMMNMTPNQKLLLKKSKVFSSSFDENSHTTTV